MNVLHVSETPLVAAPQKISNSLNLYTNFKSNCIVNTDYSGNKKNIFIDKTILNNKNNFLKVINLLKNTDIVHIHNDISISFQNLIKTHCKESTKFIYQTHSYLREGPLYYDRSDFLPFDFLKKLAVAQYQPRIYPDFNMVPNIIEFQPTLNINNDKNTKILYSPAQKSSYGRWGKKYSNNLEKAIELLNTFKNTEVKTISGLSPSQLYSLRTTYDITIDEISTGGFHQISLEGLCAGNLVINGADFFSKEIAKNTFMSEKHPPFFTLNEDNVEVKLLELVKNKAMINCIKKESYEYFLKYLSPKKLIKSYEKIYMEII